MTTDSRSEQLLWFVAVALAALVIFKVVDSGLYAVLPPPWNMLADVRLTSAALLVGTCLVRADARAYLYWPRRRPSQRIWVLCLVVLTMAFLFPAVTGIGFVSLPRWQDRLAFHGVGVWNEELLCRGLVLGAAVSLTKAGEPASMWASASSSTLRAPAVWAATLVFSLMHAQYHDFTPSPALYAQLLWTLPVGLACSALAFETQSIWPSVLVHGVNNALVALAERVQGA